MPTDFGNDFAPTWEGRPPGMSPEDYGLWQRWRLPQIHRYEKYNFNVRLIRDDPLPPNLPTNMIKMWKDNNAKRIDVLGWGGSTVDIIELRTSAGLSAIGQLIGYFRFLLAQPPSTSPLRMILVTDRADGTVRDAAEFSNISIEIT